jgi:hypothetical protein
MICYCLYVTHVLEESEEKTLSSCEESSRSPGRFYLVIWMDNLYAENRVIKFPVDCLQFWNT